VVYTYFHLMFAYSLRFKITVSDLVPPLKRNIRAFRSLFYYFTEGVQLWERFGFASARFLAWVLGPDGRISRLEMNFQNRRCTTSTFTTHRPVAHSSQFGDFGGHWNRVVLEVLFATSVVAGSFKLGRKISTENYSTFQWETSPSKTSQVTTVRSGRLFLAWRTKRVAISELYCTTSVVAVLSTCLDSFSL
jgi:hypothetical protein